jgi:hypothetical protein
VIISPQPDPRAARSRAKGHDTRPGDRRHLKALRQGVYNASLYNEPTHLPASGGEGAAGGVEHLQGLGVQEGRSSTRLNREAAGHHIFLAMPPGTTHGGSNLEHKRGGHCGASSSLRPPPRGPALSPKPTASSTHASPSRPMASFARGSWLVPAREEAQGGSGLPREGVCESRQICHPEAHKGAG